MKAGNSGPGSVLIGRAEAMSAFDALPASLRKYLGRGPYNWSSIEVLKLYQQTGGDAFTVVDRLRRLNAERKRKYYEDAETGFRNLKG